MRKGPRYEVQTKYGWFSLDEGAYQDYLAGKLWITWPPEKGDEKPKADHVPQNISEQALALRDTANNKGVFEALALHYLAFHSKVATEFFHTEELSDWFGELQE